jgi:DNA-binding IclR family transcriptional regulator
LELSFPTDRLQSLAFFLGWRYRITEIMSAFLSSGALLFVSSSKSLVSISVGLTLLGLSMGLNIPSGVAGEILIWKIGGAKAAIGASLDEIIAAAQKAMDNTRSILVNVDIRDRAAPFLRELAEHCKETVYLTVPDGYYCLYIYAIETSHRLQARSAIGNRVPYHCTSVGRALLASMPKEQVEEIIRAAGLPKFSELTITTKEELFAELEKIRARGYGIDLGQHDENVYWIGAPIFNQCSQVIPSCSLASLRKEIVTEKLEIYANYLLYTTQEISRRMGYVYDKTSYQNILENPFRKEQSIAR